MTVAAMLRNVAPTTVPIGGVTPQSVGSGGGSAVIAGNNGPDGGWFGAGGGESRNGASDTFNAESTFCVQRFSIHPAKLVRAERLWTTYDDD